MLTEALKNEIQEAYRRTLKGLDLKPRLGQRQMIAQIARTLGALQLDTEGQRLGDAPLCALEAGTGTGKTLAYLLAALPIAQAKGLKLVVTTATVALQEQIIHKDLPALARHSGLLFRSALAKGRRRYLCHSKLDKLIASQGPEQASLYPDELFGPQDARSRALYRDFDEALASGRWDGERDSWEEEIDDLVWSDVTTDHRQCTGRRCRYVNQCVFYRAREGLAEADIIIANHDLLLADLALGGGAILPEPEQTIYVIDEGHHLPDKALSHFAQQTRLRNTLRWLEQSDKSLASVWALMPEDLALRRRWHAFAADWAELVRKQQEALLLCEQLLQAAPEGGGTLRFEQGVVHPELRDLAAELARGFQRWQELLGALATELEAAMDSTAHPVSRPEAELWYPWVASVQARAESNAQLWMDYAQASVAKEPPDARWLAGIERSSPIEDIEVASSPVLASHTLRNNLWSRCAAAVVTSATLTALNRFDRFRQRAGLPDYALTEMLPAALDYQGKGLLVVPSLSADPGDPLAHTRLLIERLPSLLEQERGTLVLFASRAQMEEVVQGLPAHWQSELLVQGGLSKQRLIERHKERIDRGERSTIFGLASFSEGVDLPGEYCRHVIITKIPFAVPDAPVEAALAEWISSRGGNPFMQITVPDAALKLVQACGRLLRTESDHGCITLLDRRILTRRYGQALLDSLPPFRRQLARQ